MVHKRGPAERASRRVIERTRSADTSTLVEQEPDLHDDPELGHAVVLHHGLELLGPDRLDIADRAGRALDRFPDRILVALRGLARQFDELRNGHGCLPPSLSPTMVGPEPLEGNPLTARYHWRATLDIPKHCPACFCSRKWGFFLVACGAMPRAPVHGRRRAVLTWAMASFRAVVQLRTLVRACSSAWHARNVLRTGRKPITNRS